MNRNGFTFLTAIFMVMIMGIMLGLTGQSWKTIMKREREKELLFRGSQIKEAIENWNNPRYTIPGVPLRSRVHPLMNLEDLLDAKYSPTPIRFLPHSYATKLDDKNPKCAPDCAGTKLFQDPMTGKEWTIIRGNIGPNGAVQIINSTIGPIIGVASKSDEEPLRTDFKDTALENMVSAGGVNPAGGAAGTVLPGTTGTSPIGTTPTSPGGMGKMTKYSDWKFIADPKNDHTKIYKAYHERW